MPLGAEAQRDGQCPRSPGCAAPGGSRGDSRARRPRRRQGPLGGGAGPGAAPRGMLAARRDTGYRIQALRAAPRARSPGRSRAAPPARMAAHPSTGLPHPAANAVRREGGGIPWGSTRLPLLGGWVVAWAGRHPRSAFPGLGGRRCRDIERKLRDTPKAPRLPPRRGQSAAEPRSRRSPRLTQPGASPEGRTAGSGRDPHAGMRFLRDAPGARAVSGARCAALRAAMLRTRLARDRR
ncbi:uncharacterized protein LOC120502368 isoform X2 [Passer montanus]|uniref:uncharacterized protein LOC120502368 isoform X1 n=1 Tax=Passer montanus TaxID=9160 RepID=UPI0019604332|nr:uncharacterized protein LOC120502368 isoform X1 [Passer montanus]XP_039565651.1 uncharacterized protein LOC120502368 isoform X2 [Passer montanus]